MAVDETELNFIRCPNCRSLVPAIATRCRMCGFVLKDHNGTTAAPVSEERPSRVRQRTITVTGNDVEQAHVYRVSEKPEETVPKREEVSLTDDHLSSIKSQESDPQSVVAGGQFTGEPFKSPVPEAEEPGDDQEQISSVPGKRIARPRKIIRRLRKRASSSKRPSVSNKHSKNKPGVAVSNYTVSNHAGSSNSDKPVEVSTVVQSSALLSFTEPQFISYDFKPGEEGHIVGWLVSYHEDLKGRCNELRSGRFFIGRDRLRPSDLVIEHPSVSTPQCLVVCDPNGRVIVQDLMSERGTRISRSGKSFEYQSEQVQLEHGDRIRLGEYEMLVVLLPSKSL